MFYQVVVLVQPPDELNLLDRVDPTEDVAVVPNGSEKTVKMQGMEWKGVEGQAKGSGRPMQRQWKVKAKAVEGQGQSVEGQGSAVTR